MIDKRSFTLGVPEFCFEDLGFWLERADDQTTSDVTNLMREGFDYRSVSALTYVVRGGNKEKIYEFHVLPSGLSLPIVSIELREALSRYILPSEAVFVPVELVNLDHEFKCWALAPTEHRPCTDFANSAVRTWLIPGEVVLKFDKVCFREDARGGKSIVRNSNYPAHVVMSIEVAEVFTKFGRMICEVVPS